MFLQGNSENHWGSRETHWLRNVCCSRTREQISLCPQRNITCTYEESFVFVPFSLPLEILLISQYCQNNKAVISFPMASFLWANLMSIVTKKRFFLEDEALRVKQVGDKINLLKRDDANFFLFFFLLRNPFWYKDLDSLMWPKQNKGCDHSFLAVPFSL